MNEQFTNWQEWLTVVAYLGFTFLIVWAVFTTSNKF